MVSGTIYDTIKLQSMNNKWMQKKDSGNVLSKDEKEKRANWTAEERMIHDYQQQMIDDREKSKSLEIANKVTAGETLTPEEEQYLEKNDPEALKRYRDSKAEKKAYEEKLKNCKTKDEVNRLKTNTLNGYLASMKKIEHDPYIPISEKLAKAQELLAKTRNISDAEEKFMQTSEYKNLPTEADETIERAEQTRDENEELIAEIIENNENSEETNEIVDNEDLESDIKNNNDSDKKKKTKISNTPEIEIQKSYERIKFSADLEENEMENSKNVSTDTGRGKSIDYSI